MKNVFNLITIDLRTPLNGVVYKVLAKYLFIDAPKDCKAVMEINGIKFDLTKINSIEMQNINEFKVYSSQPYDGVIRIYAINCGAKLENTSYSLDDLSLIVNAIANTFKYHTK